MHLPMWNLAPRLASLRPDSRVSRPDRLASPFCLIRYRSGSGPRVMASFAVESVVLPINGQRYTRGERERERSMEQERRKKEKTMYLWNYIYIYMENFLWRMARRLKFASFVERKGGRRRDILMHRSLLDRFEYMERSVL